MLVVFLRLEWQSHSQACPEPSQMLDRKKQFVSQAGREDTAVSVFAGDQRDAGVTLLQEELCCCLYSFG